MKAARDRLAGALRHATVALSGPSGLEGTGFLIAPRLVLTCAHVIAGRSGRLPDFVTASAAAWPSDLELAVRTDGFRPAAAGGPDLALLEAAGDLPGIPALVADQVDPGDELWAFGHPTGQYRGGEPVVYRYEGPSQAADGAVLLRATQGTTWPGHSGSPVLNWRTGAICGVVRLGSASDGAPRARLIPSAAITAAFPWLDAHPPWAPYQHDWLDLLDDRQLRAAGFRYAGPRLRGYLQAARDAAREHPYLLTQAAPPLTTVYLRQQATRQPGPQVEPDGEARPPEAAASLIEADSLLEYHCGAQVIGGPGAGKSSLLRYITDVTASRWLDGQDAGYVPVRVPAKALCDGRALPDALAKAVVAEIGAKVTDLDLAGLFADEPVADVPWLVLVDGVDELLEGRLRHQALDAVAYHRRHSPTYRFIVTSRPLSDMTLRQLRNDEAPAYDIEPFNDVQLPQFALGWFRALSLPEPDKVVARFMARVERSRLQQLARIPLIAAMMCVVFGGDPEQALPLSRAELYEKFVGRLLDKQRWPLDVRRKLRDWVRPYGKAAEDAAQKLIDELEHLLNALADYRQRGGTGTLAGRAAEMTRPEIPPGIPAAEWEELIREVLRQSGVLVERSGDFTFVHQSIQDYLSACFRAEQFPHPASRRGSGWLPASQAWPWPESEVTVFLAEIFISRGVDISSPLARLLRWRNRARNAQFIAELVAHGALPSQRIRDRAAAALATTVTARSTVRNDEWLTAIRVLTSLDQARAIATLTGLATGDKARRRHESSSRRVEAARIVLGIDPGRGLPLLKRLADDKSVRPFDRLRVGRAVAELDPADGIACFTTLLTDPAIDQYAYLESAKALGELDPGQALAVLSRTFTGQETSAEGRIRALQALGELDYAHDVLENLSRDTKDISLRIKAAETLHHSDRQRGENALAAIAVDHHLDSSVRIHLLEKLEALEYPQAVEVRAQLQADGTIAEHNRRMEAIRKAEEEERRRQETEKRKAEEAAKQRQQQAQVRMAQAEKRRQETQKRKAKAERRRQQVQTRKAEAERRRQQVQARKAEAAEKRKRKTGKPKAEAGKRGKGGVASSRSTRKR